MAPLMSPIDLKVIADEEANAIIAIVNGRWAAYRLCRHLVSSSSSPKRIRFHQILPSFSFIPLSSCVDLMVDFDYGSRYFEENFAKKVQSKEDKEATTKIPVDAFLC